VAAILRGSGFRIGVGGQVAYPGLPAGMVVSQRPVAGFQLSKSHDLISVEITR
jgi:hypothetical protein